MPRAAHEFGPVGGRPDKGCPPAHKQRPGSAVGWRSLTRCHPGPICSNGSRSLLRPRAWSCPSRIYVLRRHVCPKASHVRQPRPRRFRHRQRPLAEGISAPGAADQRAGAGHAGAVRRRSSRGKTGGVPRAAGRRRDAGRPAAGGFRGGARGGAPGARPAAFRRADDRRHGAARRQDRRDEDRRGQDAGRDAAGLPQRAGRQGRACRHRQRLPGAARRRVDGPGLRLPRHDAPA